jgi:phosphatidylglycerophosphatase A
MLTVRSQRCAAQDMIILRNKFAMKRIHRSDAPTPGALARADVLHLAAFGFGAGLAPRAPGTFGTLIAVPIYLVARELNLIWYLSVVVALFIIGIWLCGRTAGALHAPDHPAIVFDEIVGFLITMIAAPPGWQWVIAGFVLFRLFDIIKPPPIGLLDRKVHGGFGIMLDDAVAGVLAALTLQGLAWATTNF